MTDSPPDPRTPAPLAGQSVGFLGPEGTFTEQALLSQSDLAALDLVALPSIPEVLAAVSDGRVDLGFVALENSIEGAVTVTVDTLAFETDLLIQREVEMGVQMNLLAPSGVGVGDVRRVLSIPVASAQCRGYLHSEMPAATLVATSSTVEAASLVAGVEHDGHTAAIAPAVAAKLYGLDVLASDIEDHPDNTTRFVVVARQGIPPSSGHDKTSIVVFQRTDRPGSLLAILQEFSARSINLTKLESRPTKKGLGNYCFLIDLEGHVGEELVADCLRDLKSKVEDVKFLGSYPAAGEHGPARRRDAEAAWRDANRWLGHLRGQIGSSSPHD
ncbi:MAG TPA: prephenate dehydratase [Acidimicrobiales bacterium]|jgi:prephenate dehydratase|nr:prephenate dehydratase [Acidimicrobiales bacterium]